MENSISQLVSQRFPISQPIPTGTTRAGFPTYKCAGFIQEFIWASENMLLPAIGYRIHLHGEGGGLVEVTGYVGSGDEKNGYFIGLVVSSL